METNVTQSFSSCNMFFFITEKELVRKKPELDRSEPKEDENWTKRRRKW